METAALNSSPKKELSPTGQKALELIGEYLGKYTADIYRSFYLDKDDQLIMSSANELLVEVVGNNKAIELMAEKFGASFNPTNETNR